MKVVKRNFCGVRHKKYLINQINLEEPLDKRNKIEN